MTVVLSPLLLVIGYWLVAAELANKQQTTNNKPGDRPYAEDLVLF